MRQLGLNKNTRFGLRSLEFRRKFQETHSVILHATLPPMTASHEFESDYARNKLPETKFVRNLVVAESKSFVALPSVGSLVEGWLLIVPRCPALCMGALGNELLRELAEFADEVTEKLEQEFGAVGLFEHGPNKRNSSVGCGVDYAHLHLVPVDIDLRKEAQSLLPELQWVSTKGLEELRQAHRENKPYLYLRQSQFCGEHLLAKSETDFPSQFFRKIISRSLGREGEFDWKTHPHVENMQRTYEQLSLVNIS